MGSDERASERAIGRLWRGGADDDGLLLVLSRGCYLSVLFDSFCTSDAKKWIGKTILRITYTELRHRDHRLKRWQNVVVVASCSKREGGEAAAGFFSFCSRPIEELIRHCSFADLRSSFGQQVPLREGVNEGGVRRSLFTFLFSSLRPPIARLSSVRKFQTASFAAASTVAPHSMSPNVEEEEGVDDDGCSLMFLVFYLVLCD